MQVCGRNRGSIRQRCLGAENFALTLVQHILPTEVRETAQLYFEGKIDQWYSLQDQAGVAFILNVTDVSQAHEMLEALPLGKAHLMAFSLLPIGPLKPLSKLLNPPSAQ
ncbi:hypothetical protein [Burkholderia sp. Bp8998]|uniref:hypothetical protein n=1 Tax=Burkholderia sp. Bp8998 TaxID=2184557 RepID=UPI0021AB20CC|nr:hypothetical protein [Burkholderia sp. Bp8998]